MRFGNAVEAPDPQMLDFSVLQKCIAGFGADPQYLAHLFDIQDIRVIPKHDTVGITGIQVFFAQIILFLYTNSFNFEKQFIEVKAGNNAFLNLLHFILRKPT